MRISTRSLLWLLCTAWLYSACGDDTNEGVTDVGGAEEETTRPGLGAADASDGSSDDTDDTDDAGAAVDTRSPTDVGSDAPSDSGTSDTSVPDTAPADTGGSLTPLDPALSVPPRGREPCETPGSSFECGDLEICRLYAAEESRCESCETCGNLNASCSASNECDILFTCYLGRCTAMCSFETPQTCGNPSDCVDVGHPTYGVCLPF